jgi:hypothetical protein
MRGNHVEKENTHMSSSHRKTAARHLADALRIPYQTALNAIDDALGHAYPAGIPTSPRQRPAPSTESEPLSPNMVDDRWGRFRTTSFLPAPTDYSAYGWSQFPLGIGLDGDEVILDLEVFPHLLIAGRSGAGKSNIQRLLLDRALASDAWRVLAIDPKRVELADYREHPRTVSIATELEESVALLELAEQEITARYTRMNETGVLHFRVLPARPPALLITVDEAFALLCPENIRSAEGEQRDALRMRASLLLESIALLGRAAGVHLSLNTQRPDVSVIGGVLKSNLDARIACGPMSANQSLLAMDSDAACWTPDGRGNCMLWKGSELEGFRAYRAG